MRHIRIFQVDYHLAGSSQLYRQRVVADNALAACEEVKRHCSQYALFDPTEVQLVASTLEQTLITEE